MVTQIQLGNIFTQNDRKVVSGGASGFDVEGLIKGIIEAKRLPAVTLEDGIKESAKTSTALGEMRTILNKFKDAANFLRNPPGVQNASDNVFEYRSASLVSNSSVAASNYLAVTVKPGAKNTNYEVQVKQLAESNIQVTNTMNVADLDTAIVGAGAGFPLQNGVISLGASGRSVGLNAGDTLAQVVAKINAVKDSSGVEAGTIKVADGQYRLSLKTIKTGAAEDYSLAASAVFSNVGFSIVNSAQDSIINIDGTDIQRSTNSFDDVVEDVSFKLLQETPIGTNIKTTISADIEIAKQGIMNFVNAYNEFRLFSSKQSLTGDDGKPLEDSVLSSNNALRFANSRVNDEMANVVRGLAAADPNRLADIGIKFTDFPGNDTDPFTRNILTVDEDALKSALETNFDAVRKVFEFDYSSDSSNFQIFQRNNGLAINNFQVRIIGTNYTASYVDQLGVTQVVPLDGEPASSGDGVVLKGRNSTVLSGLVMIYGAAGDATINVNATQGLGDRLYNSLDDMVKKDTGALDIELNSMVTRDERSKARITIIDEQLSRYREQLLKQFSALESAINSANTLLQSLDAQANARNNS